MPSWGFDPRGNADPFNVSRLFPKSQDDDVSNALAVRDAAISTESLEGWALHGGHETWDVLDSWRGARASEPTESVDYHPQSECSAHLSYALSGLLLPDSDLVGNFDSTATLVGVARWAWFPDPKTHRPIINKGLEVKFPGRGALTARDRVHLFHALDELSKKLLIHL